MRKTKETQVIKISIEPEISVVKGMLDHDIYNPKALRSQY